LTTGGASWQLSSGPVSKRPRVSEAEAPADDGDAFQSCAIAQTQRRTSPQLGPSLVNQSSDDVDAGTATVALLKSDNTSHGAASASVIELSLSDQRA
jgi:hypothetical protein